MTPGIRARWAPTRRARERDETGDTTSPPHDGKDRPTLSEELEDGATIGPGQISRICQTCKIVIEYE